MDSNFFLQSLRNGDNTGIRKIYEELFPKVKSFIIKRDGNIDDAKEIMQKALLQVSTRAQDQNFTLKSSFDAYFMVVCKNLWIRTIKKRKLRVTNDNIIALVSEEAEIAMSTYEQERWELFQEKLQIISENCREILKLFFNKVSYKKIAELKAYANENTVKQRIFKCKARLKEAIQADIRYRELVHL